MSCISIEGFHLLGEQRYTANGTLVAAHGYVACRDVGEGRELGAVSFTTPWNRITIPRRRALHHHKRTFHGVQLRILG